jgi:hypothetical protein
MKTKFLVRLSATFVLTLSGEALAATAVKVKSTLNTTDANGAPSAEK